MAKTVTIKVWNPGGKAPTAYVFGGQFSTVKNRINAQEDGFAEFELAEDSAIGRVRLNCSHIISVEETRDA